MSRFFLPFLMISSDHFILEISSLSVFTRSRRKNNEKTTCPIVAPTSGRVWKLCKGEQFQAPSADEQLAGVKSSNAMKCTPPMGFKDLCCLDYANVQMLMTESGSMTLDLAQHKKDGAAVAMTQVGEDSANLANYFLDDAAAQGPKAEQITLCTQSSPPPGTGTSSAKVEPVECIAREFSLPEVQGPHLPVEGNPVLNERVSYLQSSGVPFASIPLCVEEVIACPCNGLPPASAAQKYVSARQNGAAPVLLEEEAHGGKSTAGDKTGTKMENFVGALMTSGSFTMMAAHGTGF